MNDPHGDSPVLEWRVRATAAEMERILADVLARRHGHALPEALLDVDAPAAYVGVHRNTVYEAAKAGKLRYRSVGRLRLFTIADLDDWTGGRSIKPRVLRDGRRRYVVRVRVAGQRRGATFRTRRHAEEMERHWEDEERRRRSGLPADRGPIAFDDLCDRYLEQHQVAARTIRTLRERLLYSRRRSRARSCVSSGRTRSRAGTHASRCTRRRARTRCGRCGKSGGGRPLGLPQHEPRRSERRADAGRATSRDHAVRIVGRSPRRRRRGRCMPLADPLRVRDRTAAAGMAGAAMARPRSPRPILSRPPHRPRRHRQPEGKDERRAPDDQPAATSARRALGAPHPP